MRDPADRIIYDTGGRDLLAEAAARPSALPATTSSGLSLADLKAAAAEAGIDPADVELAARRHLAKARVLPASMAGLPRFLAVDRRVPGSVDTAHPADLVGVIRTGLGELTGETTELRDGLEWSGGGDALQRHVSVSSRDGVATIRASTDLSMLSIRAGVPTGVIGTLIAIAAGIGFSNTGGLNFLVLALAILPVLYMIVRFTLGRVADAESARLETTVNELAELLSRPPDA
jgi:hypothetical protein